jgi:Mg-chelatase subunit ChlD
VEAIVELMNESTSEDRIRAVVLLSDGEDTAEGGITLNQALQAVSASRETANPVIVVPVAYGANADIQALGSIARASNTTVQSGNPDDILAVLEVISSFF